MGGKGGEKKTEVKIPKELKKQAIANMELSNYVSRLPLMRNFGGAVAALTPQQQAGMAASDSAAASLGMPSAGFGGPNTGMNMPGMPAAQNFGGIQAYSTQPVYEDAMSRVPKNIREMYSTLFNPGSTLGAPQARANSPAGGKGGSTEGVVRSYAMPTDNGAVVIRPDGTRAYYSDMASAQRSTGLTDLAHSMGSK